MTSSVDKEILENLHVLIVDDDKDVLLVLEHILLAMGIGHIHQASDGDQALEFFRDANNPVDLVICDWMMPGKSGLVVLKLVRSKYPDLPFLMVTAKGGADDVKAAVEAGVSGYIVKPFMPDDIETKILKLVMDLRPE